MVSYEESYLNTRPQYLCKMCGKCCRLATSSKPYRELKQMFENGEPAAIDFLSVFVPYSSVEEARSVDSEIVDNIISLLKADGNYNEDNITFYYCKYLGEDNLCTNYADRPLLCRHFPSSPWAIVPPDCGYEGWLFEKREDIKQKVRKEKEELIELKLLKNKTRDEETLKKIELVEQKIERNIKLYQKYGSENW